MGEWGGGEEWGRREVHEEHMNVQLFRQSKAKQLCLKRKRRAASGRI